VSVWVSCPRQHQRRECQQHRRCELDPIGAVEAILGDLVEPLTDTERRDGLPDAIPRRDGGRAHPCDPVSFVLIDVVTVGIGVESLAPVGIAMITAHVSTAALQLRLERMRH
jgi:hypothetical protein